jgi:hypothetical protein
MESSWGQEQYWLGQGSRVHKSRLDGLSGLEIGSGKFDPEFLHSKYCFTQKEPVRARLSKLIVGRNCPLKIRRSIPRELCNNIKHGTRIIRYSQCLNVSLPVASADFVCTQIATVDDNERHSLRTISTVRSIIRVLVVVCIFHDAPKLNRYSIREI